MRNRRIFGSPVSFNPSCLVILYHISVHGLGQ